MIIISIDLQYFIDYTRTNISSNDVQSLTDDYNKQYHQAISTFDILINSDRADTIYKNSIPYKCIVDYGKSHKAYQNSQTNFATREIKTKHSDSFSVGDIVEFENKISKEKEVCIFTNKKETVDGYDISTIQKCNNTLRYYKSGILYNVPCVVTDKLNMSDDDNRYITTLADETYILVPNNLTTQLIELNQIFKIGKWNWKICGINDIAQVGLLRLKAKITTEEQTTHTYRIEITNGSNIRVSQSQSLSLHTKVYCDNDLLSPTPPLKYVSSNNSVATIDNNGNITFIGLGIVTFTVYLESDNEIFNTITVDIIADETHNYTVEFVNPYPTFINKGKSAIFNCIFKDNGNIISEQSQFYLTDDNEVSNTLLAQISNQDSIANSCIVTASNTIGYFKLWVKNIDGNIVCSNPLRIQIKNIV